jgi:transposase InsO family protein
VNDPALDGESPEEPLDGPAGDPSSPPSGGPSRPPPLCARRRGGSLKKPEAHARKELTPQERLLVLDTWRRSGLPAGDFAGLVGVSAHTLYQWKRRFEEEGPAGLMDRERGRPKGSRLPDLTRRTILMLKQSNPEWGCQRISDMLLRGPALPASAGAVARVLKEAGYEFEEEPTRPHPEQPRRFERAKPNQLWQTDLFTFILKRQNRRVYLVGFLDDHSRFMVGYGLHATQSAALVLEVLRAAVASYQSPEEILTDNGAQYVTWRGKSAFTRELEQRGIRQIVAKPRRPQTLGKVERFWGTLWRECVETSVFLDLADAQRRIGLFIDHYNFQRPHSALGGLVPADRYFGAAPEVLRALKERVASNALDLARNGVPKTPFYLTGNAGGKPFSVHAEGERVILRRGEGEREEIELVGPTSAEPASPPEDPTELPVPICPRGSPSRGDPLVEHEEVPPPGTSPLDGGLERLREVIGGFEHGVESDGNQHSDDGSDPDGDRDGRGEEGGDEA